MDYIVGKKYEKNKAGAIREWWKSHREFDIWEHEDYIELKERSEEDKKLVLRDRRAPLLCAFDKWEKAVLRGREDDDETIMSWYNAILELDSKAIFYDVPERIKYYM